MTPDLIDLARRAVASPKWRWLPGMGVRRWSDYDVLWRTNRVSILAERGTFWLSEGWIPDLTDPATLGCLLALVREAWGEVMISANATVDGWVVNAPLARNLACCDTEVEALVAALEAAP